ncbi:MAG: signal peptide peptidase SppA [Candidatus Dormibacterales bacterium]
MLLFPFRYLWWLVASVRRAIGRPPDFVIFIVDGDLPPQPDPRRPLWQRFTSRPRLSLKELSDRLDEVGRDARIRGVVLHLRPTPLPMASLEDLRERVAMLRAAGKRVVAWATSYTTGSYFLACACAEIVVMPTGQIAPLGFSTTGMFLADALARFGISADFVQISPYKTAADSLTRSTMSDEHRAQLTWLLESHHKELVRAIGEGRGFDGERAEQLIDVSPLGDKAALDRHAVDAIVSEESLGAHLAKGSQDPVTLGTWENARRRMRTPAPKLGRGKYVALVRIEGTIVDGRSGRLPVAPPVEIPIVGEDRAGDLTVVQVARQVAADPRAAAAVLYVNSRGGSATASEAMRQALAVIASRKPLVVAMGPIAGSGGYLVAAPAAWIVARPSTLTGSIGVLTGKAVTGPMWSKLLVNRETITFGEHAALENEERPYTEAERLIVKREVDRIYAAFVDVVAAARGLAAEELEPIAQGKVWTGRQAFERRLVDELGGLDAAAAKARDLAGLAHDAPLREMRTARRAVAPPTSESTAAWLGHLLQGWSLLSRGQAMTLMDYLPPKLR